MDGHYRIRYYIPALVQNLRRHKGEIAPVTPDRLSVRPQPDLCGGPTVLKASSAIGLPRVRAIARTRQGHMGR